MIHESINQVVVTGVTGPLGIALCKYLSELGISVTAIAHPGSSRNADIPVSNQIQVVECGLADLSSLTEKLKHNYIDNYNDGDIALSFVLNAKGYLMRIDVDTGKSTKNKTLIDVALLSLQEAAPFPPFPKELDVPQLPFGVTISFKEKNDW